MLLTGIMSEKETIFIVGAPDPLPSTQDCPYNCSFNGWCSVEFPVSRCMCGPGYYGDHCQYLECLNNCSYPHGTCDSSTGECSCEMTFSPYNNTR